MAIRKENTNAILDNELSFVLRDEVMYPDQQQEGMMDDTQVAGLGNIAGLLKNIKGKARTDVRTSDVMDVYNERDGIERGVSKDELDEILTGMEAEEATMLNDEGVPMAKPEEEIPMAAPEEPLTTAEDDPLLQGYMDEQTPDPYAEKRTDDRNINIQRHHEGATANKDLENMPPDEALEHMETADDIAKLLTVVGKQSEKGASRTHEEIAARTDSLPKIREELKAIFEADPETVGALTDVQLHAVRRMLTTLAEDTTKLANDIAGGNEKMETLLQWQKKSEAFVALNKFVSGKVKESARALSQQNMIAKTLRDNEGNPTDITGMVDFLNSESGYRSKADVVVSATNMARDAKLRGAEKAAVKNSKPDARDYWKAAMEFYTHNLISGFQTFAINGLGTPIAAGYTNLLVKPIAYGIGVGKKAVGIDSYDRITVTETVAGLAGATTGLWDGLFSFGRTLKTGKSEFGAEKGEEVRGAMHKIFGYWGEKAGGETGQAIGEGTAVGLTAGYRVLSATDSFWKVGIFRSELTSLAARRAVAEDLDVNTFINDVLTRPNDFPDLYSQAQNSALKHTFTETDRPGLLGDMARNTKAFISAHPYLKIIAPFVDTPLNLLHFATEASPLGVFSKQLRADAAEGGAKQDMAVAQVVAGSALWVGAYQLYEAGVLTGGQEWKEMDLVRQAGGEAKALFIDGKYYTVDKADPLAMSVFGLIDSIEKTSHAKTEEEFLMLFGQGIINIGANALDASFMTGVNDFMNVLRGDKSFEQWASSVGTGFIPYSGTLRSLTKLVDPQPRKVLDDKHIQTGFGYKMSQKLDSINPLKSKDLNPARYWDGTPKIPKGGKPVYLMDISDRLMNAVSPFQVRKPPKPDRQTEALIANSVNPTYPSPLITFGKDAVSMIEFDGGEGKIYDKFVKRVGELRRENVTEVIESDGYQEADGGYLSDRQRMLNKAISKAKKTAMSEFLEDVLPEYIDSNPEAISEVAKAIGVDPELFIEMAKAQMLRDDLQEKVILRSQSEKGELPLPLHRKNKSQSMPRF